MLDVIMEGNDGEMEEFGPSLSEDLIIQTFPFSVVVPAALEARNKLPENKGKPSIWINSCKLKGGEWSSVLEQKMGFALKHTLIYCYILSSLRCCA